MADVANRLLGVVGVTFAVWLFLSWDTAPLLTRGAKHFVAFFVGIVVVAAVVGDGVLLSLTYPVPSNRDPLIAPLQVASVHGNRFELLDGRILIIQRSRPGPGSWNEKRFGGRIDLEATGSSEFIMFVCDRSGGCGHDGPWITLPLIPVDFPRYRRVKFGVGHFADQPGQAEAELQDAEPGVGADSR